MSQSPVMPIWTDALIGDTTHLSAEEFGAYCLILFATWRNNGKPLKNDDTILSRVCRVQKTYFKAKLKLVLLEFFDISDGYLHQKRLEKEWLRRQNFIASRRLNGARGGRPKALKYNGTGKPSAEPSANLVGNLNESYPNPIRKKESLSNESRQNAPTRRAVAESMVEVWKLELGSILSSPTKLTDRRVTSAAARHHGDFHDDIEEWRAHCRAIRDTPFLTGDNDKQWRADFDWAIKAESVLRVREGKYLRTAPTAAALAANCELVNSRMKPWW